MNYRWSLPILALALLSCSEKTTTPGDDPTPDLSSSSSSYGASSPASSAAVSADPEPALGTVTEVVHGILPELQRPVWANGALYGIGHGGGSAQVWRLVPGALPQVVVRPGNFPIRYIYLSGYGSMLAWIQEDWSWTYPLWAEMEGSQRAPVSPSTAFKELVTAAQDYVAWIDYRNYSAANGQGVEIYWSQGTVDMRLTSDGIFKTRPHASPEMLAWIQYPGSVGELHAWNPLDSGFAQVPGATGHRDRPSVFGASVVWEEYPDSAPETGNIFAWSWGEAAPVEVCSAPGHQGSPSISQNWIVWEDLREGFVTLYAQHRASGEEYRVLPQENRDYACCAALNGDTLAYLALEDGLGFSVRARLLALPTQN